MNLGPFEDCSYVKMFTIFLNCKLVIICIYTIRIYMYLLCRKSRLKQRTKCEAAARKVSSRNVSDVSCKKIVVRFELRRNTPLLD